jgi:methyl-accepting chemotaxis protein
MKQNWTIGKRIYGLAGLLAVGIAGITTFAVLRTNSLKTISETISGDSMPGVAASAGLNASLADAHIRVLGLLRANTPEDRKAIRDEVAQIAAAVKEKVDKYEKTITASDERQLFTTIKERREEYLKVREQFFAVVETNAAAATQLVDGPLKSDYTAYDKAVKALLVYNMIAGEQEAAALAKQVQSTRVLLMVVGGLTLLLGMVASGFLVRRTNAILGGVVDSVASGAEQIASAAGQVSAASQSLAEGASEQAASLEETSSSLEEMASMTKRNAESSKQAKDLADNTKSAAEAGSQGVQAMSQSMDAIQASSNEMRQAMGAVKDSNNEVAKIIKTIDEIAFQTNILALNAAVEAARAGEAGLGFAVVADEVRNLAQKSAAAARETTSKIEAAIGRTEVGVRVSEKVVDDLKTVLVQARQVEASLKGIEQKSKEVAGLVGEIAAASLEQSQGIGQVNTAMSQMDRVTQSNAASAEESASAAEELNAQAATMSDTVSELQQLVGGNQEGRGPKSEVRGQKTEVVKAQNRTHPTAPKSAGKSRPAGSRGNGNGYHTTESSPAVPALTSTRGGNGHEIPLLNDFKDF